MALINFNGMLASVAGGFTNAGITSFSYEGGDRAQIDVTTSASTRRESLAGFASERRISLGLLLDTADIAQLDALIAACAPAALAVTEKPCGGADTAFLGLNVYTMSYSVSGQLDGVLEVNVDFMVAE